ncbi:MAG: tetratricopeptide repeat protein [Treponema sp.]|jgi:tetratricopeptide (TPR) repeat protein|nr:tetratricopeptide repeat protein [Treponema sp.]
MKLDPVLAKGIRLLRRKKYGEVIRILEAEIFRFRDNFKYYYTLALSCLLSGEFGGAFDFFKRARDIKMREPLALLGLAVLYLRRGDTDKAVDLYLEVQELDPKNRIAHRALKIIRKHGGAENIIAWANSGKLPTLYPPKPSLPFSRLSLILPLAALALLFFSGLFFVKFDVLNLFNKSGDQRRGIENTLLARDEQEAPVQTGGSYRYVLTRNEVLTVYSKAQSLFSQFRDEAAKVELNRLIESNASEGIKNKARLLMSYTGLPGFDTLKDQYRYGQVINEPPLFRDCYVIWQGMAANLVTEENGTSFNLLVGYDTKTTLEGIVPVYFDFVIPINTERPLEVLGKVIPVSTAKGLDIKLQGVAVHQSGLLVQEPEKN